MSVYARWMRAWERSLSQRDLRRVTLPFDWGLDWLGLEGNGGGSPREKIIAWSREVLADPRSFFEPPGPLEAEREGDRLRFATPLEGPHESNNTGQVRIFPGGGQRAVIVVPQWNADAASHVGLCRLLARLGFSAYRLTPPYHEQRAPFGMKRAELMVSSNIGRTLASVRQAVMEVVALARWLEARGYRQVGIVGTSLGSCLAFLAFCHEPLLRAATFNHVSSFFADVVWDGQATRWVRRGLEGNLGLEDLRRCWACISPWFHIDRLRGDRRPQQMITCRFDATFPPPLTALVLEQYRKYNVACRVVELPCGHYSLARFPFNYLDGWHICRFFRRVLR